MNKKYSIILFVITTMLISCSTNMSTINNINNKQFKQLKKVTPKTYYIYYKKFVKNYRNIILNDILEEKQYKQLYITEIINQMNLTKYYGYILADNIVAYSFNIDLMNNVFCWNKILLTEYNKNNIYNVFFNENNFSILRNKLNHSSIVYDAEYIFLLKIVFNSKINIETISFYDFSEHKIIYE